jgi:tetratricopeptide (TPR) repeat protein
MREFQPMDILMKYIACSVLLSILLVTGPAAFAEAPPGSATPEYSTPAETDQPSPVDQSPAEVTIPAATAPYVTGANADRELYALWNAAREAVRSKDYDTTRQKLKDLKNLCLDLGITAHEPLSAAIAKEAMRLIDSNDITGATMLFDTAELISPNYPVSYYAEGWGVLSQNKHKFLVAIDSLIEGINSSAKDFWWLLAYAGNKETSLLFSLAALFSLFGIFIARRYIPLLAHDVSEKLNRVESEGMVKYVVLPAISIAVLLLLGYWWAVTLTLVLLWVYFNKREKSLAVIFFLLLVFMPEVMTHYTGFLKAGGNKMLWAVDAVNKGRVSPDTEKYLAGVLENEQDNRLALFSIAKLQKIQRRYEDSLKTYDRLEELDPGNAAYYINAGNIHFLNNDYEEAEKSYKSAIEKEPGNVLAHYNLSRVYGDQLKFAGRDEEDRIASKLDPDFVSVLKRKAGEIPIRIATDAMVPVDDMLGIAFEKQSAGESLASSMWSTTVKVMPLEGASFAGVGFIILVVAINLLAKNKKFAHFCKKCGKVSCNSCQKPYYNAELCPQCHQIFVKLDGVEARDRLRKTLEIREKESKEGRVYRISSLLLPGSGHYLYGRPVRGFFFSGLFIFLLKDIFFGSFIEDQYAFALNIIGPDTVIMFGLLVLVYMMTQFDIYRITKK